MEVAQAEPEIYSHQEEVVGLEDEQGLHPEADAQRVGRVGSSNWNSGRQSSSQ